MCVRSNCYNKAALILENRIKRKKRQRKLVHKFGSSSLVFGVVLFVSTNAEDKSPQTFFSGQQHISLGVDAFPSDVSQTPNFHILVI